MTPSDPVRIVTSGKSKPVRIVNSGLSKPVRIVTEGLNDPVRIVTDGISDPIRIVNTPIDYADKVKGISPNNLIAYYPLSEALGSTKIESLVQKDANILMNGGFEDYNITHFPSWYVIKGAPALNYETVDVHSGTGALKIIADAQYWQCYVEARFDGNVSRQMASVPGYTYTLKFWTHGDGTHDGIYYVIDNTHSTYLIAQTHTGITGLSYAQVTRTFAVPAGCLSFSVFLSVEATGHIVYYDDVEVIMPAAAKPFIGYPNLVTFGVNGIGDGRTAARIGGTGFISLYRTAFMNMLDRDLGTIMIWYRYKDPADWPGGLAQTMWHFMSKDTGVAARDHIWMEKDVEDGAFYHSFFYAVYTNPFDTQHIEYIKPYNLNWHCLICSWNATGNNLSLFEDGNRPAVYLPPYNANPDGIETPMRDIPWGMDVGQGIGAMQGQRFWKGDLAHFAYWNKQLSAEECLILSII